MNEKQILENFSYTKGVGKTMFSSLKDALVYPIRGHNIWKFFVFTFAISVVSFLTASMNSPGIGIVISIFISAYFWMCLYNLTRGDTNLPGLRDNSGSGAWWRGVAVQFMLLVLGLPIVFLIAFTGLPRYQSLFLFGIFFYLYFAIAVVRYVYEEKAIAMYDVAGNIRIIVQNWRACLKLLVSTTTVVILAIAIYLAVVFAIIMVINPPTSPEPKGLVIVISLIRDGIIWYVCFVNTYLFYRFGVLLGYFESPDTKVKVVEPAKPYRSISERLRQL